MGVWLWEAASYLNRLKGLGLVWKNEGEKIHQISLYTQEILSQEAHRKARKNQGKKQEEHCEFPYEWGIFSTPQILRM